MSLSGELRTVRQLAEECPAISLHALKHIVHKREVNGLLDYKAIISLGRRLYIHKGRFEEWLESQYD